MAAYSLGTMGAWAVTSHTDQIITGAKTFQAAATGTTPVTVKGVVGQTGNLQEWRDDAGTVLGAFYADGGISARNFAAVNTNSGTVPVLIRGAAAQTSNLTEWQDSAGTVLASVNQYGEFGTIYNVSVGALDRTLGALGVFSRSGGGTKGIVVRGAVSQTANLFEAQTNSGAVALAVNSVGYLTFPGAGAGQTSSLIQARRGGNSIEFGHGNQAGYGSVLGAENGSGAPTVVFAGEHGTTSNTYTSRGFRTIALRYAPSTSPYLAIGSVADANLANQALSEFFRIDTRGYVDIGAQGHIGRVSIRAGHLAEKALVIRGEVSQSGHLQEWQDSAGASLMRVTAGGNIEGNKHVKLGPNSSGKYYIISTSAGPDANTASTFVSNGNLHIDSATTAGIYFGWYATSTAGVFFGNGAGVQVGRVDGGGAATFVSVSSTSTRDSKSEIKRYSSTGPSDQDFLKLAPVSYVPKSDPAGRRLHSFIAEEVAEVMPEVVSTSEDGTPEGINLTSLVTILTAQVQNLTARVRELEAAQ